MKNTIKTLAQKFVGDVNSNDSNDYDMITTIDKFQGIIEFSLDRRILAANDILHKIFGYSPGSMTTMDYGMLVDNKYRDSAQYHKFWQKLNGGEFEAGDYLFRTRDGEELWIHAAFSPVRDQDGRLLKVVGLMTDITDTKSEQIEELNELKVRASIADMTSIVSDSNLKGEILTVNDKYTEVSKYSREELEGQPHSITRHPDMPKEVFKQVWATIGRGETFRGVIKNLAKDGTAYFVDAVIAPVMGKNGKPRKYIGVRYDITEAELERQNMKGVFDAIDSYYAYIEFDLEGKVLTANKNFLQLMEYQEEDVVGKHHRIFVDPSLANSEEYLSFWENLKAGKAQTDTYKRVTKTGKGVWIQATYSPIKDEMGRIVKFVKIASDVTQEKLEVVGQLDAIGKAQALVEFSMEGNILAVNDNFLNIVGFTRNEVVGQHYNFLLDPVNRNESEHQALWEKLRRGENDANQLNFISKDSRSLWIQASSCSLVDLNNKPFKVVMYATDISQQIDTTRMLQAAVEQTKVVISAAQEGDLAQRVSVEDKEGEIANLCVSVNSLLELTDAVMSEVGYVLAALAEGNLNERIVTSYQGDFGKLTNNVNLTTENLQQIVGSIAESAKIISVTSGEIVSGNTDLSDRTEKQAANLEETAASIEELTSTVKQNADNANHANQRAIGASGVAEKGGEVVGQVVETMSSINESSKKIVDIISVIDGIAFQTNILALNAAVEAARAGEQGRGFAVVATEVRNLAQRSAAAAKEIKTLISDSVCKVEDGTKLVDEAGETMNEIVTSIKHVTDIMSEITAASHEQSMGIGQVNEAITQIDEVTQQNAALVEESTAAAMEMQNQAGELTKAISAFDLKDSGHTHASANKPERRSVETRPFNGAQRQGGAPTTKPQSQPTRPALSKAKVASGGSKEDDWNEF